MIECDVCWKEIEKDEKFLKVVYGKERKIFHVHKGCFFNRLELDWSDEDLLYSVEIKEEEVK